MIVRGVRITPPNESPVDAIERAIALFFLNHLATIVVAGIRDDALNPAPKNI
jgi:hypothetical protein